jgi:hypothetical protein
MTRGQVCSFQLLPGIASAIFLGSESRDTHEHYIIVSLERESESQSQSYITVTLHDSQSVSQSVCLGVEPSLGLLTRDLFFFESHCPVTWGRPL